MERLSMSHPRSHVMITGGARMTSLTAEIEAGEVAIIKYLASCYRRAFEECKKWKVCSIIDLNIFISLHALVLSFVGQVFPACKPSTYLFTHLTIKSLCRPPSCT